MEILFHKTSSGRETVKEFIEALPFETRHEILVLLRRLQGGEVLTMPHSRSLSSMAHGLYELRVRDSQGNVRIFYYTKVHGALYIVHGLRKKTRVISDRDRALILKRIKEVGKKSRSNI